MSEGPRRAWFSRRAFADWIDARIDKAIKSFAVAETHVRMLEQSHQIEARAQLATLEAVSQAEQSSIHRMEIHSQAMLAQVQQMLMDFRQQSAHDLECRSQLAAMDAKAYADSGLYALSGAVGAANRVVAKSSRQLGALERASSSALEQMDKLEHTAAMLEKQIEGQNHQSTKIGTDAAERIDRVVEQLKGLQDRTADALTQAVERIDGRVARHETLVLQFEETARQVHDLTAFRDAVASGDITSGWLLEVKELLSGLKPNFDSVVADYNAQLRNAEHRIEFVRSEVLYELQASLVKASLQKTISDQREAIVAARIINPDKVASHRKSGLRLNIGCGHIQPDGFLNVDSREIPGIDVVAEATNIPFANGEITEIFSSHLVEHFPANILHRVLLPHWHDLLESGGTLTTTAPDGAAMLDAVTKGAMSFEDYREVLFGSQDYDGDYHYNLLTPESFCKSLELAGFANIEIEYLGRKNGKCFEFKIAARKL
jgi:hypothetical protein